MKRVHPLTALLWVASVVAVVWAADHIVVSLAGLVTLCAVAIVAGGPRRSVWIPAGEVCAALVVLWLLLLVSALGHSITTGAVVVTLPSISFGSQQIGGPIHTGATISAANHAAQACVAVIAGATLVQLRPARNWLDLGMCWLGRGARIIAPGVCVAEGIASAVADRARLRCAGLRTSRLDALLDGIDRGRQIESRWEEARLARSPRPWARVLAVTATLAVMLVCVRHTMPGWTLWHIAVLDPWRDRALMVAAGLWAVTGLAMLMVRGLPGVGRLRLVDVYLVLATIATAVAWRLRDRTGDGRALTSTAGTPLVMCAAMVAGAAAVVFSFNAGGRHA